MGVEGGARAQGRTAVGPGKAPGPGGRLWCPCPQGGLGADPPLSSQVKSSLQLLPDHLPLLKLCPPGAEEGKDRLPGRGRGSVHPCRSRDGEVAPASQPEKCPSLGRHRKCCQTPLLPTPVGMECADMQISRPRPWGFWFCILGTRRRRW